MAKNLTRRVARARNLAVTSADLFAPRTMPTRIIDAFLERQARHGRTRPRCTSTRRRTLGRRCAGASIATTFGSPARALIALGVAPGEHVTIIGFNCAEWFIADLGRDRRRRGSGRDLHHQHARAVPVRRASLRGARGLRRKCRAAREVPRDSRSAAVARRRRDDARGARRRRRAVVVRTSSSSAARSTSACSMRASPRSAPMTCARSSTRRARPAFRRR